MLSWMRHNTHTEIMASSQELFRSLISLTTAATFYTQNHLTEEMALPAIAMLRHLHSKGDLDFSIPMDPVTGQEFLGGFGNLLPSTSLLNACVELGGSDQLVRHPVSGTSVFVSLVEQALRSSNDAVLEALIQLLPPSHAALGHWDKDGSSFGGGLMHLLLTNEKPLPLAMKALERHDVDLRGTVATRPLAAFIHHPESWRLGQAQGVDFHQCGVHARHPDRPLWQVLLKNIVLAESVRDWGKSQPNATEITQRVNDAIFFNDFTRLSDVEGIKSHIKARPEALHARDATGQNVLMRAARISSASLKALALQKNFPESLWTERDDAGRSLWFHAILGAAAATDATLKNGFVELLERKVGRAAIKDDKGRGMLWQMANSNKFNTLSSRYRDLSKVFTIEMLWGPTERSGNIDHWERLVKQSLAKQANPVWFYGIVRWLSHSSMTGFMEHDYTSSAKVMGWLRLMDAAYTTHLPSSQQGYNSTTSNGIEGPWLITSKTSVIMPEMTQELWELVNVRRAKTLENGAEKCNSARPQAWQGLVSRYEQNELRIALEDTPAASPARPRARL